MKRLQIIVLAAALLAGCICLASFSVTKAQNIITSLTLNGASPETVITFKAIDGKKKVEVLVQDTPGTLATTDDLARAIAAIPIATPTPGPSPTPSATCDVCYAAGSKVLDATGNSSVVFRKPFAEPPVCVLTQVAPLAGAVNVVYGPPAKAVTAAGITISGGLPGSKVDYVCAPPTD